MGIHARGRLRIRASLTALTAYLLALAAMLAQVGSYAHLATTAHVTCAEHGELIEAGHAADMATPRADAAPETRIAAALDAGHGHEHCAASPHRRDRAGHQLPRAARLASLPLATGAQPPPSVHTASIELIRIAPKSSPPLA